MHIYIALLYYILVYVDDNRTDQVPCRCNFFFCLQTISGKMNELRECFGFSMNQCQFANIFINFSNENHHFQQILNQMNEREVFCFQSHVVLKLQSI